MGLDLEYINGQTPLDEEEKLGLKIETISTREELDEFEQKNIEEVIQWLFSQKLNAKSILTEEFIRKLHKRMYGEVWSWAGEFRKTDKNIGIDKWQIPTELKKLLGDILYWIDHETYKPEEIAIRFKHRIVSIHCFPNGNGRHSRLLADIVMSKIYDLPEFTWGSGNLAEEEGDRESYISAGREADKNNFTPLLAFAKS